MFLGYILHKIRLKIIFTLFLGFLSCYYIFQIIQFHSKPEYPTLMWWTPLMGENDKIIDCGPKYKCLLTKDRSRSNNPNLQAILFYGSQFEFWDLPIPKSKKWALFHEESPRNKAVFLYNQSFDVFDITSTFSRYSDLPLTLQYLQSLSNITDNKYVLSVEEKNKHLDSISPVVYIQSDCDTPIERDSYVKKLMKYIPVDSYGACLHNKDFPPYMSSVEPLDLYNPSFLNFIAKYKFVIAFENGICEDYITEKLWRPLMVGSVPIYMGSPSVEDWLPNKKSAILAKNFPDPEQLAMYISEINRNDTLYKNFLEHKNGKVENVLLKNTLSRGPYGIDKTNEDHPVSGFECFVCRQIQDNLSKNHKMKSVYDCLAPNKGNDWEYYWQSGECQSKSLVNSVKNNVKLETDPC